MTNKVDTLRSGGCYNQGMGEDKKKDLVLQMQVEIKPLEEGDIEQLDPILRQHVRDRYTQAILGEEIADIEDYMRGGKDEYGRSRKYLVAKSAEGRVWGCMGLTVMDPDLVKHLPDKDPKETMELVNAFVDSEVYRGGGVGKKLFDAICEMARAERKKYLTLSSGPRYKASWGFYDRFCDENTGMIIGKFGPGGDANTWLKRL